MNGRGGRRGAGRLDGVDPPVGRGDLLSAVLDGPVGTLHDVVGPPGSGKSTVLLYLDHALRARGATVVRVSGSRILGTGVAGREGSATVTAHAALVSCGEAVRAMSHDLARHRGGPYRGPGAADAVAERLTAAIRGAFRDKDLPPTPQYAARLGSFRPEPAGGSGPWPMATWFDAIRARLRHDTAEALSMAPEPAVLVDDFDRIEGTPRRGLAPVPPRFPGDLPPGRRPAPRPRRPAGGRAAPSRPSGRAGGPSPPGPTA